MIPTRRRLRRIRKGEQITANPFLNSIIEELDWALDEIQAPRQVTESEIAEEEGPLERAHLTLVKENEDTLTCKDPDGAIITVAKPPEIRGAVNTRVVVDETQVIIPPYTVGSSIYAMNGFRGGTGVTGVSYIDLNVSGRYWAEDPDA